MTQSETRPYIQLYTLELRNLTEKLGVKQARSAMWVLLELANHTDEFGVCWPGIRRLAGLTRYSPATVEQAITALVEIDYLAIHEEKSVRGLSRTYQLSPEVVRISPEHLPQALQLWKTRNVKKILMKVVEPESESDSNKTQNQKQNQESNNKQSSTAYKPMTPHPDADDIQREAQDRFSSDFENDPPHHTDDKKTDDAQRAAQTTQRVAPDLKRFNVPLAAAPDEARAMELSTWGGGTNRHQARYLIATYGANKVRHAMQHIESLGTTVRSPQGLLRTLLQNNTVPEPIRRDDDTDLNQSEYAHLFNR